LSAYARLFAAGLAAACASVASSGCVVLPAAYHARRHDLGHGPVDAAALRRLTPGGVTRDQVEAALGQPTLRLNGGRLLVYAWVTTREVHYLWGLASPSGHAAGGAGMLGGGDRHHHLALEFDDANVLRRKRLRHGARVNPRAAGVADVFE
jgi:hypothetical protein